METDFEVNGLLFLGADLGADRLWELVGPLPALFFWDIFAVGGCGDQLAALLGNLRTVRLEVTVRDLLAHFLGNLLTSGTNSIGSLVCSCSTRTDIFILCGAVLGVVWLVYGDALLRVYDGALLLVLCAALPVEAGCTFSFI